MDRIKGALLITVAAALSFMSFTLTVVLLVAFYWLMGGSLPDSLLSILSVMTGLTALIGENFSLRALAVFVIGALSLFKTREAYPPLDAIVTEIPPLNNEMIEQFSEAIRNSGRKKTP